MPDALAAAGAADELLLSVLEQASICGHAYRGNALRRRLPACLRALRVASVDEADALLKQRPDLLAVAVDALLLGVTGFFRDAPVFQSLAERWLPELAAQRRRPLRVWSAGCSDGQELYSVAMLLGELSLLEGSDLLGTDCRADAIARARAGVYPRQVADALGPQRATRWFTAVGASEIRAAAALRIAARWEIADLLGSAVPAGPWDAILCRNLAIYLNAAHAELLWARLVAALAPGGILVVGKAERPPGGLPLMRLSACIYRKREG